ncbi:MAG: FAD-dependent oxidoreductase, partial [Gammaproteobacteria bacterium]
VGAAFIAELVISFGLMWLVLTTTNIRRLNRYTGLFAGLLVATFIALEAPVSGMSMNPARTFGSALPAHAWTGLWIYFSAPPLGMLLAAELYLRTKGSASILCCKLHHENNERCIFRCRYPHAMGQTAEISTAGPSQGIHRRDRFGRVLGWMSDAMRFAERSVAPFVDLVIRLGLAQIFLVSAILKLSNWENAITLATYEYPVSWMDPVTAAYAGIAIELAGGALLAVGLATRFAAAAMLALSLVIQFNYVVLDANLFWAVLFGWYAVRGAGPLSVDRALRRGLGDSALPFAAAGIRLATSATRTLGPTYQLLLRVWIAAALAIAGWRLAVETHRTGADLLGHLQLWLPLKTAAAYPTYVALICAPLIAIGLATRAAALTLVLVTLAVPMTDSTLTLYWLSVFGLFVLCGPGSLSVDALIERGLRRLFPQLEGKPAFSLDGLPRVVVVGAGFGGLACAAALRRTRVSVTLIDRHNYHLFQPLLYQVATTALSPGDIATPVRGLFREHFNIRVLLGEVTGIDTTAQQVLLADQRLPYDYLVLATGASHSYFGRDEWEPYAPGLKRIEDATDVRRRLLTAFERAEATTDEDERRTLLTFLIVGGGPTGVELAGAIAELAKYGMEKEFRRFDPATARVILVQSGPRVLPTFPERLSERAKQALEKLGVQVLVDNRVEDIDEAGVMVSGRRIAARTVFWAAGVVASPAARWLGAEADKAGRLKVNADLTVPGLPNVFAIGDTASVDAWKGGPVPGLAPAAQQGGVYVARVIRARIEGRGPPGAFAYKHFGSLATIGRKAAVDDFGGLGLSGAPDWWLWGAVHV